MVASYLDTNDSNFKVQWIVFTDKEDEIGADLRLRLSDSLVVVKAAHQSWPLPTLLRYEYLTNISEQISGRLVMHLDADMLFVSQVDFPEIESALGPKGVALVRHPGFFRPTGLKKINFYLTNIKNLARDCRTKLRFGGLGSWERNAESRAFVPRDQRKVYVCGGTWIGRKEVILSLCNELSSRINEDLNDGIIAVFHDESHLNWYQSKYQPALLNPAFCFDPRYPQLKDLKPKILAVNKNTKSKWVR
jgi:histo-blood group ABO system transferase